MAKNLQRVPSPRKLKEAFVQDLKAVWKFVAERHGDKSPYAFVLYGLEDTPRLMPQVLFTETLEQVSKRYIEDQIYETTEKARKNLKYSVADSPLFDEFSDLLPTVDALFGPVAVELGETRGYEKLAKSAIEAFKQLADEGCFGTGKAREDLLLAIITEDTEKDWSLKSAKALNSAVSYERFKKHGEIDGTYQSSDAMTFTSDGRVLILVGGCKNPKYGKGNNSEFLGSISVYERTGFILKKRWEYQIDGFGDSFVDVRMLPDDEHFLVLRRKLTNGNHAILMKFNILSNQVLTEYRFIGEAMRFDVSPDANHVAVSLNHGRVLLLNDQFAVLTEIKLDKKVIKPLFVNNDQLLLGSDDRIDVFDIEAMEIAEVIDVPGFCLGCNRKNGLIAATRWFPPSVYLEKRVPFGIRVFSQLDHKHFRDIFLPEFQLVNPAISDDGRYLAASACPLEGYLYRVVIIDLSSGEMIGSYKSDSLAADLYFLPGTSVLAMTISGYMYAPPVKLISVGSASTSE